ncbi:hypothetical protein G6O67_000621 [Ophiocordyceps sinensis]|uniref:Uncharacterized protein n=1 Tax=Ophiocordyceps sinensis TaxID=72228 RepID=A0A8H4PZG9_9HYPO|nr:hypothetical protein G6O67_000621 [Ophiocordyceps sinensis]
METWSPMRNLIDHEWRQFDSESCPEAFCGGYDEHRDESWKTSWDVGWHGLNREKLPLLHRTNRTGWLHLLPPQSEDSLPSMPGFLHQMHCLSLLREALHRDEFSYVGNTKLNRLAFEWHTNHCLLALDTIIRCKADISPILLEEIEQTWPANV